MKKPGFLIGAYVGALATLLLLTAMYLGWQLIGFAFTPFTLFDRISRALPGNVITFGIDSLVRLIRSFNLGSTDTTAKLAEQLMAVAIFFVAGTVIGALFFAVLRALRHPGLPNGIIVGVACGMALLLGEYMITLLGSVWVLGLFMLWGALLGWAYNRLSGVIATPVPARAPAPDHVEQIDRRRFLITLGGATAAITVVGSAVGTLMGKQEITPTGQAWSATHGLPNADDPVKPAPGTRPEFTPLDKHYRIDINAVPPKVDEATWQLAIGGLVEQPLNQKLADLRRYQPTDQFITLQCISNPLGGDLISTTRWTGVSLQQLLPDWKLKPNATHLKISSVDGFWELLALDTIKADPRIMLCYEWDGLPLRTEHGFPLRIYVPDLYGMKQPKWISTIEAVDHWEPGYWVVRSWNKVAQMQTTSVIDTIAVDQKTTDSSGKTLVPIGGIAHAGARGISKVEVQVDDGAWQAAQLRKPMSGVAWTLWRYDMPFSAGQHNVSVRCYDGTGALQPTNATDPHPDGATGINSKSATL